MTNHGSGHEGIYNELAAQRDRIAALEAQDDADNNRLDDYRRRIGALEAIAHDRHPDSLQVALDLVAHENTAHHTHDATVPVESPDPPVEPPSQSNRPIIDLREFGNLNMAVFQQALMEIPDEKALFVPDGDYVLNGDSLFLRSHCDLVLEGPGVRIWQNDWNQALFRTPGLTEFNFYGNGATLGIEYPMEPDGVTRMRRWPDGTKVRGGGKIFEPRGLDNVTVPMQHLGFYDIFIKQHPGWAFYAAADDVTIDGWRDENALQPQSTNIDDGMDIVGQTFRLKNIWLANHDDCMAIKCFSQTRPTRDIEIDGLYMTGSDVGLAFGADVRGGGIDTIAARNVVAEDCGVIVNFKNYLASTATVPNLGQIRDVMLEDWMVKGATYRYVDFLTSARERVKTCHDITFENWDLSKSWINNVTRWKDFGGGATAVLHAERQGPNLNGLDAIRGAA